MARKLPVRPPGIDHEAVPVPAPSACGGICFDMSCPRCWSEFFDTCLSAELWFMPVVPDPTMVQMTVGLDPTTSDALWVEASKYGPAAAAVAGAVLQEWAATRKKR